MLHTLIGIAYLQLFIINNFLGPKTELDNLEQSISNVNIYFFNIDSFFDTLVFQTTINDLLTCDGETPVSTIEHSDYLYQSLKVFNTESNKPDQHWV